MCVSSFQVYQILKIKKKAGCESEEDKSTLDSDEVAEKEEGPEGMESNRGDEWEEEREYEDVHDDLGILAVSEDDKTGNHVVSGTNM